MDPVSYLFPVKVPKHEHTHSWDSERPLRPQVFVTILALCVCGCAGDRNNSVLQSRSTTLEVGVKLLSEKRRAGYHSRRRVLFPLTGCGKEHSDTPFLDPQTLYYSSRTQGGGWKGGGVEAGWTEELFSWGGIKTEECTLALAKQYW